MMKAAVTVRDTDRGFNKLVEVLRRSKKALLVGLPGQIGNEKHPNADLSLAQLANYLEFGTDTIPARPFLSGTIDANMGAYKKASVSIAEKVVAQRSKLENELQLLGERILSDVKKNIVSHIPPPNSPSTILKKGSSTPLIDTGHLMGSLTYEVVEGR